MSDGRNKRKARDAEDGDGDAKKAKQDTTIGALLGSDDDEGDELYEDVSVTPYHDQVLQEWESEFLNSMQKPEEKRKECFRAIRALHDGILCLLFSGAILDAPSDPELTNIGSLFHQAWKECCDNDYWFGMFIVTLVHLVRPYLTDPKFTHLWKNIFSNNPQKVFRFYYAASWQKAGDSLCNHHPFTAFQGGESMRVIHFGGKKIMRLMDKFKGVDTKKIEAVLAPYTKGCGTAEYTAACHEICSPILIEILESKGSVKRRGVPFPIQSGGVGNARIMRAYWADCLFGGGFYPHLVAILQKAPHRHRHRPPPLPPPPPAAAQQADREPLRCTPWEAVKRWVPSEATAGAPAASLGELKAGPPAFCTSNVERASFAISGGGFLPIHILRVNKNAANCMEARAGDGHLSPVLRRIHVDDFDQHRMLTRDELESRFQVGYSEEDLNAMWERCRSHAFPQRCTAAASCGDSGERGGLWQSGAKYVPARPGEEGEARWYPATLKSANQCEAHFAALGLEGALLPLQKMHAIPLQQLSNDAIEATLLSVVEQDDGPGEAQELTTVVADYASFALGESAYVFIPRVTGVVDCDGVRFTLVQKSVSCCDVTMTTRDQRCKTSKFLVFRGAATVNVFCSNHGKCKVTAHACSTPAIRQALNMVAMHINDGEEAQGDIDMELSQVQISTTVCRGLDLGGIYEAARASFQSTLSAYCDPKASGPPPPPQAPIVDVIPHKPHNLQLNLHMCIQHLNVEGDLQGVHVKVEQNGVVTLLFSKLNKLRKEVAGDGSSAAAGGEMVTCIKAAEGVMKAVWGYICASSLPAGPF